MNWIKRFKTLPASSRRLLTAGIIIAFVVALPLSIVSFVNQKLIFAPRAENGPTNACGGTCGSIYNCNVNLFCFIANGETSGVCRNPDCATSTNCVCPTATPVPKSTPVKTVKPTPTPIATPVVITLATTTPIPTSTPFESVAPAIQTQTNPNTSTAILIAIVLAALIVTLITINSLMQRSPRR